MEIKGYEVIKELSQGPISTVFLGQQLSLNRPVLIKRLNSQWINEKDLLERFRREALICAQLKHKNIVNIIDVSTNPDNLYLIIEYIDGIDLEKFIRYYHPIPFELLLYIAKEILKGLDYAHSQEVIHRDIKPSNIMISKNGLIKISDFGLAKISHLPQITMHGEVVGTPSYMSPEQARVSNLDARTDLFSLGVTLYELVTKFNPFRGENIVDSIQKIIKSKPRPIDEDFQDIPGWFSDLISKMLQKKPNKRPASARVILDIKQFKHLEKNGNDLGLFIRELASENEELFRNNGLEHIASTTSDERLSKTRAKTVFKRKSKIIKTVIFSVVLLVGAFAVQITLQKSGNITLDKSKNNLSVVNITDTLTQEQIINPEINNPDSTDSKTTNPGNVSQKEIAKTAKNVPASHGSNPIEDLNEIPVSVDKTHDKEVGIDQNRTPDTLALLTPKNNILSLPAKLYVKCLPWADVYINGVKKETTPLSQPLILSPGDYTLELVNSNYKTHRQKITLAAAQSDTISVNLTFSEGYLNMQVKPWANVYINGKFFETTPLDDFISLAPGRYEIKLLNPVYKTWVDSIEIVAQKTVTKIVKLTK